MNRIVRTLCIYKIRKVKDESTMIQCHDIATVQDPKSKFSKSDRNTKGKQRRFEKQNATLSLDRAAVTVARSESAKTSSQANKVKRKKYLYKDMTMTIYNLISFD